MIGVGNTPADRDAWKQRCIRKARRDPNVIPRLLTWQPG